MKSEIEVEHKELAEPGGSVSSIVGSALSVVCAASHVRPIPRPEIDRDLERLSFLERVAEVLRYSIARLEYSISATGELRAWFKGSLSLALLLAIPAVLIMPVLTAIFGTFVTWSGFFAAFAENLFWGAVYLIATAFLVCLIPLVLRLMRD
jgi:hypothetical protein